MSAGDIKDIVDRFTSNVYRRIRQSLYEEDRLFFATLLCLNIQAENDESLNESEISILMQGNPGLNIPLSLSDFDCSSPTPEWIPSDKWEEILAMSCLPGPTADLCVHVANNSESWESWFTAIEPENEPLPIIPVPKTPHQGDTKSDTNPNSATTGTSVGKFGDIHQLIIIRVLRPDRLPMALHKFLNRNLSLNVPDQSPMKFSEIQSSMGTSQYGILVLLPHNPYTIQKHLLSDMKMVESPADIIKNIAKDSGIHLENIKMDDEARSSQLESLFETTESNEGWVLIEDLHLANDDFFKELRYHLKRFSRTRGPVEEGKESKFCIWMTSQPCDRIPQDLLQHLHKLSWDSVTPELMSESASAAQAQQTEGGAENGGDSGENNGESGENGEMVEYPSIKNVLVDAILSSIKSLPPSTIEAFKEASGPQYTFLYGLCVIHGMIKARQTFGTRGLSQWYPLSSIQLEQGGEAILETIKEGNEQEAGLLSDKIGRIVYGNTVCTSWDREYIDVIAMRIIYELAKQPDSIKIGNIDLPCPPAGTAPDQFADMLTEKLDTLDISTTEGLMLNKRVEREYNDATAYHLLFQLDRLYETFKMDPGEVAPAAFENVSMHRLRSSLDLCLEKLPPFLELGDRSKGDKIEFNFPYHVPSVLSSSTVSLTQMPESLGFILLQECLWLNTIFGHIRQIIYDLQQCLLTGPESIPVVLKNAAMSLQQENVPVNWIHANCQPCTHTLLTWLKDVRTRYDQMRTWVKSGMVPKLSHNRLPTPHGRITNVWLGGLVNPQALLTALKHEKAVISGCLFDEITLTCEVLKAGQDKLEKEEDAAFYCRDLYVQGAVWDSEKGALCIDQESADVNPMPVVYIKAVLRSEIDAKPDEEVKEDGEQPKICHLPLFMNRSKQVVCTSLPIPSTVEEEDLIEAGVCILIDSGILDGMQKRTRTVRYWKQQAQIALSSNLSGFEEDDLEIEDRKAETSIQDDKNSKQYNSHESQLSYRAFTPKGVPLPPGLNLQREPASLTQKEQEGDQYKSQDTHRTTDSHKTGTDKPLSIILSPREDKYNSKDTLGTGRRSKESKYTSKDSLEKDKYMSKDSIKRSSQATMQDKYASKNSVRSKGSRLSRTSKEDKYQSNDSVHSERGKEPGSETERSNQSKLEQKEDNTSVGQSTARSEQKESKYESKTSVESKNTNNSNSERVRSRENVKSDDEHESGGETYRTENTETVASPRSEKGTKSPDTERSSRRADNDVKSPRSEKSTARESDPASPRSDSSKNKSPRGRGSRESVRSSHHSPGRKSRSPSPKSNKGRGHSKSPRGSRNSSPAEKSPRGRSRSKSPKGSHGGSQAGSRRGSKQD